MKSFEIHITGEKGINEEFDKLGIKNIIVELLYPDKSILRTEYMSSFIKKFKTIHDCRDYVNALCCSLNSKIIRVKIETPYYEEYVDNSLYIESHFTPFSKEYPISRNQKSNKLMATDRIYEKNQYNRFRKQWIFNEIELCVYDSFVTEDEDWFNLYKND